MTRSTRHWLRHRAGTSAPHVPGGHSCTTRDDAGFTLVELVIVITIMPLIIGALAMALVAMFSLSSTTAARLTNSSDAQVVASGFTQDVRSAVQITTGSTPACGTGTQLVGLEWNFSTSTNTFQTVVTYAIIPAGSLDELVREYCAAGASTTPTSTSTVAFDVSPTATTVTLTPTGTGAGTSWVCTSVGTAAVTTTTSSSCVTNVQLNVNATQTNYNYTLTAAPDAGSSQATGGLVNTPQTATTCSFATPGTGTYASNMCFIDFAPIAQGASLHANAATGVSMSVGGLPGGYTMSFTVQVTGSSPWTAHGFPTWQTSNAGAFLGDCINLSSSPPGIAQATSSGSCPSGYSPFYTGVAGSPAIYQTDTSYSGGSTNTVTISNIKVFNSLGQPATGWQVVMADAESTDPGEWITFSSDKTLTVMPNNQISGQPYGNACNYGGALTWIGTTQVTCAGPSSGNSYVKTGTLMLDVAAPSFVSAQMHGTGLEGVALALLLSGSY